MSKKKIKELELRIAQLEIELMKKKPMFGVFYLETGELTKWQFDSFEEAEKQALGLDKWSLSIVDGGFAYLGVKKYIVKPI